MSPTTVNPPTTHSPVVPAQDQGQSSAQPESLQPPSAQPQISTQSVRTNSTASRGSSRSANRVPRFAEATTVISPGTGAETYRSPFSDPPNVASSQSKPSDVGFVPLSDNQPIEQHATVRSDYNGTGAPLKSALKTPGTTTRLIPPSATFREEQLLEKEEEKTEKEQAKDLKVKTRVRMAKMILRGVGFSCSLIVVSMLSTALMIFNATKALPPRNNLPAWAKNSNPWPQITVLVIASIALAFSVLVIAAYCRGGHRRAEKVAVYYTMFAVGWFVFSIVMWLVAAAVLQGSKNNGQGKDMWGWSCKDNKRRILFQDDVHYSLVCRLQDWTLICCIIEIVVEIIVIAIYGVVFYRFYTKNRLRKSMDARDRARSDLYLAQLRSHSAPNTPGYAMTPRTPHFPTTKDLQSERPATAEPVASPASPSAQSAQTNTPFKLQPAPNKGSPPMPLASNTPPPQSISPGPTDRVNQPGLAGPGEQVYDAVPIPGAYQPTATGQPH